MKIVKLILDAFIVVSFCVLVLLLLSGTVAFLINISLGNEPIALQTTSFATCFICAIAVIAYLKSDNK